MAWTIRLTVGVAVLTLVLCAAQSSGAESHAPADVLRARGLVLVGQRYLLPTDAGLADWLRQVRAAEYRTQSALKRRTNLERDIDTMEANANLMYQSWLAEKEKLSHISKNADGTYNHEVDIVNSIRGRILPLLEQIKQRQAVLQKIGDPSDEYVAITLKFGAAIDATLEQYDKLATDPEVKAAIDALTRTAATAKVALGPSDRLKAELPEITRLREKVNSDTISFDITGGVPTVPVTFNGDVTVPGIVDSGASTVSISSKLADKLGLKPGQDDKITHAIIADGSVVEVHQMILKSVRLGKFTVENVECVVVPDNGHDVDTLLGGSLLRRFVYKMDLAAGQLKLSQITEALAGDAAPHPANAPTAARSSPAGPGIPGWKITVVKAEYGTNSHRIDVTAALKRAVAQDAYMPIGADDGLIEGQDDPAKSQAKSLHVVYLAGTERREETLRPGDLCLPSDCPPDGLKDPAAGRALKITAARFGGGIHWADVTDLVRGKVADPHRLFDFANKDLGRDPYPYHEKRLVVWFTFDGSHYVAIAPEHNGIHDARLLPE